jgi:two-component system, OmpR family, sensor histidine kinase VicK
LSRLRAEAGDQFEVVRGAKETSSTLETFSGGAREHIDVCSDRNGLGLALQICGLNSAQSKAGLKIRLVTEVTRENRAFAEAVSGLVELRHLEGVALNFAVSDAGELIGATVVRGGEVVSELIHSRAQGLTSQYEQLFETLWKKAVAGEARLGELEEWEPEEGTKLLEGEGEIVSHLASMADSWEDVVACVSMKGLSSVFDALAGKLPSVMSQGGEGALGIRWLTSIGESDTALIEAFLDRGINIRHTSRLPPLSFVCSKSSLLASIETSGEKSILENVLASTDAAYVGHFRGLFEEMWKDGVDARKRLGDVARGAERSSVRVIENPQEALRVAWELVEGSSEVLLMFSTPRAFLRQVEAGAFERLKASIKAKKKTVKVLIPYEASVVPILERIKKEVPSVDFRVMNEGLMTEISILIADRSKTLILETVDDRRDELQEALGMSTFAESKPLAASYAAIFENIWKQTDMYDKLKLHEKLQSDFVNVAAHELRTPVQAIINYAELATTNAQNRDEYYGKLLRNVTRLQKLTEEILDAARIEGGTLKLNKEKFEINALVQAAVEELRIGCNAKGVDLVVIPSGSLVVEGDKGRIGQVVSNLLGNAAKFTERGSITVAVEPRAKAGLVRVSVADTGIGVDPSIVPRLFSRFVAKSQSGTGLGLYISKNIVEEHGGKIWVERNVPGGGATFAFEIPIRQGNPQRHPVSVSH